jgi:hypothetical protein
MAPPLGIAFWMGLFWRHTTPAGAWAATIAGFGGWWLATRQQFVDLVSRLPMADSLNIVAYESGSPTDIHEPWLILFYTASAVLACVLVSLVSPQIPEERLQRFYDLTRTPVKEGEVVLRPCTMPVGVEPPKRPMLLTAGGLEVPMPSAVSWAGFFAGWVAVAMLVGGFLWIIHGW